MPDQRPPQPRIDSLLMAVAIEHDGTEGLCATFHDGQWFPLIAAYPRREAFVRETAKEIAAARGIAVRLLRFENPAEVELIDGRH